MEPLSLDMDLSAVDRNAGVIPGAKRNSTKFLARPELVRGLGAPAAAAIVLGTMVGTGIFLKPGEMAGEAGSVAVVFAAWILGGILSLFGGLCYAELGASIPEAGGEYSYLRRGLGTVWGFCFGWMHSIVARPASVAAIAAGLLRFSAFLFPQIAEPIHIFHLHSPFGASHRLDFSFTWMQPLAVMALVAITFINYLGVRVGGRFQVGLTVVKILSLVVIIVAGFVLLHGQKTASTMQPFWPSHLARSTVRGLFAAIAAAVWAYDGWNDLNLVGSEVENPQRNFPRVIVGGTLLVIVLFLLFNLVCFRALSFDVIAASQHVASDVFASFAGKLAALAITAVMAISALGTLNASVLSGARVDYAMARDGLFFKFAAEVHPKYRSPGVALIFQCCMGSVMAMSGTFEDLTSLVMFGSWIFYGLAVVSMMRLRRTEPNLPRPFHTWGYPVVPVIFVAGAWAVAASLWLARPVRCSIGLALILSGLMFYRSWRSRGPLDRLLDHSHDEAEGS
jgi:basic amino acid/polyamine antiporter, APA family